MRRIVSSISQPSTFETYVCFSCRRRQQPSISTIPLSSRRLYASTASAPSTQPTESSTSQLTSPVAAANPQPKYIIRAGVLLSRAPLLSASPTPFESAFYYYQKRLNERLVLPFTQYFYFKRGTPAYEEWKARRRERAGVAGRDVGNYDAYSQDAWHDEALVGDKEDKPESIVKKLVEEEGKETFPAEEELQDLNKPLNGLRRITEADRKNDTKSLDRALPRTLYLLVKIQKPGMEKGDGYWQFPSAEVEGTEGLREAAERALESSCGPNVNTWFVANHPVGHYVRTIKPNNPPDSQSQASSSTSSPSSSPANDSQSFTLGTKSFYLKARILAGQADITSNTAGILDYQWLAKDEIEKVVAPMYWKAVKNMLAER